SSTALSRTPCGKAAGSSIPAPAASVLKPGGKPVSARPALAAPMRRRRVTMALSSLVVSSLSRDISRIFYASAPRLLNDFARQSITIDRGKFDTPGSETSSAQLAPVSPAPELVYGSEESDE